MSDRLLRSVRFLLVDNHAPTRAILRQLTSSHPGWRVVAEAENGLEAVSLARLCRPDVVLMDVVMPGMNGIRTTEKIKAMHPHIRIILYTAHQSEMFHWRAMAAGADALYSKEELNATVLKTRIQEWFLE